LLIEARTSYYSELIAGIIGEITPKARTPLCLSGDTGIDDARTMPFPVKKTQRPSAPLVELTDGRRVERNPLRLPSERRKWYQWFAPTGTPAERQLVLKLDGPIIVFVFLAYRAKVLDLFATSTAYVSGMKEDLKYQLNYLNMVYMYVSQLIETMFSTHVLLGVYYYANPPNTCSMCLTNRR
jgi:hypothetical protein